MRKASRVLVFFMLVSVLSLNAQDSPEAISDSLSVLVQRVEQLSASLNKIEDKLQKEEQEKELRKLLEEAEQLKSVKRKEKVNVNKKFHTGVRQQSGLNPNISISGDFFGAVSSENNSYINTPSDYRYGSNGFYLRELEMGVVAPLDPFTRGKSFISFTENTISIEETYMEWLNLPLHMNLKIGIFNAEFGILNRYHDHALPQFDRPRVLTNFFTSGNFGGTGLAGNFMLPRLLWADATILDLTAFNAGSGVSFAEPGDKLHVVYGANLTNFYDVTSNTFFEWRLGALHGFNDPAEQYRTTIGNLALNIKWIPSDRSKYRTFDWKTEFLVSNRETPTGTHMAKGLYSSVQNKMNQRWWISARFDYAEMPQDNAQKETAYTLATDFWQSDFVFIRWQYQFSQRDFLDSSLAPDDHTFIMQVNWAMGPHKHEAY